MSRKRATSRHLEPVPKDGAPERPTPVGFPVTIEIPTGGRGDVDGLVRELARVAFRGTLRGYEVKADGARIRCILTVQPMSNFDAEAIVAAQRGILGALVQVGVLQLKPKAAPEPEKTEVECPPSSPES